MCLPEEVLLCLGAEAEDALLLPLLASMLRPRPRLSPGVWNADPPFWNWE
jgi:hypothetical protein